MVCQTIVQAYSPELARSFIQLYAVVSACARDVAVVLVEGYKPLVAKPTQQESPQHV